MGGGQVWGDGACGCLAGQEDGGQEDRRTGGFTGQGPLFSPGLQIELRHPLFTETSFPWWGAASSWVPMPTGMGGADPPSVSPIQDYSRVSCLGEDLLPFGQLSQVILHSCLHYSPFPLSL